MLKVFGFVRRNAKLSHDEYRAAHVGHHNSYGRRLHNIRGYVLNVWANRPVSESLGALAADLTRGEPTGFNDMWDGWGQLVFDDLDAYLAGKRPARDKAGPTGLEVDELVGDVGGDGAYLYSGSPFQFHVKEHVAKPVLRPERKLFKLVQFVKAKDGTSPEDFQKACNAYGDVLAQIPGGFGCIVNYRDGLDVMTGFFPPDSEAFTEAGGKRRQVFFDTWDGLIEIWLDTPEDYIAARKGDLGKQLAQLEADHFKDLFFREVDETVVVNPNRGTPPDFYYR